MVTFIVNHQIGVYPVVLIYKDYFLIFAICFKRREETIVRKINKKIQHKLGLYAVKAVFFLLIAKLFSPVTITFAISFS